MPKARGPLCDTLFAASVWASTPARAASRTRSESVRSVHSSGCAIRLSDTPTFAASSCASKEVGPQGIRVNMVSPGPVATALWLGSHGVAETVAQETGGQPEPVADHAAKEAWPRRSTSRRSTLRRCQVGRLSASWRRTCSTTHLAVECQAVPAPMAGHHPAMPDRRVRPALSRQERDRWRVRATRSMSRRA
jgi:hypothetical protein